MRILLLYIIELEFCEWLIIYFWNYYMPRKIYSRISFLFQRKEIYKNRSFTILKRSCGFLTGKFSSFMPHGSNFELFAYLISPAKKKISIQKYTFPFLQTTRDVGCNVNIYPWLFYPFRKVKLFLCFQGLNYVFSVVWEILEFCFISASILRICL